jgi:arginase family enzyme
MLKERFGTIKIFGSAFDPLDIAERVDIKLAYLNWLKTSGESENNFLDPYDFLEIGLKKKHAAISKVEWIGKFPIDSWLTPKPFISDIRRISQPRFTEFLDKNGCYYYQNKLVDYLTKNVGSSIPVMIGVDHCLTGGVLKYLKKECENFNVLIFDSHSDIIDLETRESYFGSCLKNSVESFVGEDIYECGNFLYHLLSEKIIKPENLWIMGVQDLEQIRKNSQTFYFRKILPWINQGMHIVSKEDLIVYGIPDEINGLTYVSFDMDLGGLASVFATRFLNYVGLSTEQFLNLVHELSRKIRTRKIELIGLDIMEIDIHFLGADIDDHKDYAAELAREIIERMIYCDFEN